MSLPGRYPAPHLGNARDGTRISGVALSGGRAGKRFRASGAPCARAPSVLRRVRALPEPGAVVARLQRPRPRAGRGRPRPAARARQVPRHLQPEPRRVLRGPGLGSHGTARRRSAHHHRRRPRPRRPAPLDPGAGRRPGRPAPPRCSPRRSCPPSTTKGIRFADWDDLSVDDRAHLEEMFVDSIFPVLTPLAVDPAHPFPYISNLSLNLAVTVRDPSSGDERFARVKVPPLLPRFVAAPRRRALRAARAGHRGQARHAVPRHGGARAPPVPRHPRRRLRARRRSRRPPRGDRVGPAPAQQVRPGRAPRGRHQDDRRDARAALPRARAVRPRRQRDRRPARSRRSLVAVRPRPTRAQGRALGAADARRAAGHRPRARLLPAAPQRRRARAPPVRLVLDVGGAVRRAGRRPTRTSSRSSRPSTAPPARRARWSARW